MTNLVRHALTYAVGGGLIALALFVPAAAPFAAKLVATGAALLSVGGTPIIERKETP